MFCPGDFRERFKPLTSIQKSYNGYIIFCCCCEVLNLRNSVLTISSTLGLRGPWQDQRSGARASLLHIQQTLLCAKPWFECYCILGFSSSGSHIAISLWFAIQFEQNNWEFFFFHSSTAPPLFFTSFCCLASVIVWFCFL